MGNDPHALQPLERRATSLDEATAAVIMVHGRNAAPANILELVPSLDHPSLTFIAPAAASGTWYPYSFMAARETNEPDLSSALTMLERLVDTVSAGGVPRDRIVLLGFSQGACLTSEFAFRHTSRYGGVIVYSGGLIGPPGTTWSDGGSFDGTPVFLGCSDVDSHVPWERVEETAAVFERMGATVTRRMYAGMGHLINDEEIGFARSLLAGLVAQ